MATSMYLRKMKRHEAMKRSKKKIAMRKNSYENMDFATRSRKAAEILKSGEAKDRKQAWAILKAKG